jgi:hypothetical protein
MIGRILTEHLRIIESEGEGSVEEYEVDVLLSDGFIVQGVTLAECDAGLVLLETRAEVFVVKEDDIVRYSHIGTDLKAF